jgi:hypothetical protein
VRLSGHDRLGGCLSRQIVIIRTKSTASIPS